MDERKNESNDLDREQITTVDVIGAIECALPAIEIVDSRISDWRIGLHNTFADNASSGLCVLGNEPKSSTASI